MTGSAGQAGQSSFHKHLPHERMHLGPSAHSLQAQQPIQVLSFFWPCLGRLLFKLGSLSA